MSSTSHLETSCESGSTSEEAQGPQDNRKGSCVSKPKMGDRFSVPQLVRVGSVKENDAFSRKCQGLDGVKNHEATPLSEVREEVKARECEHEASFDNLADCESGLQVIPAGDGQNRETFAEKENSLVNGNSKTEHVSKSKEEPGSLEDNEELFTESCDSISCITTTNVFENDLNLVKNKSDIGCREKNEYEVPKNEHNVDPICNETIDSVSDKCSQDNSNVSPEVGKTNGNKDIDIMCIDKQTSKKDMPFHSKYWNSCTRENNLHNEAQNENSKSEYESESKELGSLEDEEEVSTESCDSISCITTTNVFQNDSNLVKNKSNIGCRAENENVEQKNEHSVDPIGNEAVDRVSDKCSQDNSNVSPEVEKTNGKRDINIMCIENKTSKKAFHSQNWNSCEGENNGNNEVDSERPDSIEITPVKQENEQNKTPPNLKNGKEGGSADTVIAPIEGSSDIIHQSPDGLEQQIDNEPTNKNYMKNEGQEPAKINMVSISADKFHSNHEHHEMGGIDNTCQHSEIESKSPSSQDVKCELSHSESDINIKMRYQENVNKEHPGRLPVLTELNMELSPNCAKLLTKEHNGYSSDNSSTKMSPIFQRGLFPRIAIRDSGSLASKKLRKQLFTEKEKTEKRDLQERDKVCDSTNDIKLKCAQVNLVKMNARMLSKYNVHFPSPHLGGSEGRKLNCVSLSCDGKSSANEKRNNLDHKKGCQVDSAKSLGGQHKRNAKFSPDKDTDQIVERSISVCIFDNTLCSQPPVKSRKANSRASCGKSSLEIISNNLKGSDNTLHVGMEIKRESKKRDSTLAFTPTKKQKQSEMKVARVNIMKIDDLLLLKYGYDSKGLKIDTHSPSVSSFKGNSLKTIENNVLNSPVHSIHTASLESLKDDKKEMNDAIKKSMTMHQSTNSQNARKSLNIKDVTLSNRVVSKNTFGTEKMTAKTKCSLGKGSGNFKIPQVLIKRINKESLFNDILSKKSCDLNCSKKSFKVKGSFKKTELDGKIPQTIVKRKENAALSGPILIKRSQSKTKTITKKKNSIKDKYKLKTAQVILKNINNSPLSSYILSEYLPTKRESSVSVSKTKFHIQSTEILQKRSLPKKQIISQSKNYEGVDSQNEVANKASLCKGDAEDNSKENLCLNGDLKRLKDVTVNLYKLETMFRPKV
ncbi:Protein of unknown function [Gryllus bimaculatus]|nr:Protein of unknown function [Gryllus bimaculatus]